MENFSLTHLSLVNSNKDILLDIFLDNPRDIYPFSVYGSSNRVKRSKTQHERVKTTPFGWSLSDEGGVAEHFLGEQI